MPIQKVDGSHIYHVAINDAYVSKELMRLNRKIKEIEKILELSLKQEKECTSVRFRLLKAVAEKRMTLNFLKETNKEKYKRISKILSLIGGFPISRAQL